MSINVEFAWIVSVYLLSVRLSALFLMSPIFSGMSDFTIVRTLFTIALAMMLAAGLHLQPSISSMGIGALIGATVSELFIGAMLAFGMHAAFGAFSVAGKILDIQTGFGLGSVFDPVTRTDAPIFTMALNLLAVAVFFGMDGHHALLRGIAFSAQQIPPGAGFSTAVAEAMLRQFGLMFSLGVALIAPVMFCLFLVDVGLAVVSRVLPQMNVFFVSMPVKIVAGTTIFALTIGAMGPAMNRIYASIFNYWEQVLQ